MKITFATNYTTSGGRAYKGGTTAEVNDADARSLIVRGKARRAEPESAPVETETASAPAENETDEGAE